MSICNSDYLPAFFCTARLYLKKNPVEIRALPETKQASKPHLSLPESLKEESPCYSIFLTHPSLTAATQSQEIKVFREN